MPYAAHLKTEGEVPQRNTVMLQIDSQNNDSPLKFSAVVRNLVSGVATLEVNNPWTILNWESLRGRGGGVHLFGETGEATELRGTVAWARYTVVDSDSGQLNLALKLNQPEISTLKLLHRQIQHGTEDIKSLWDRWDQARHQAHQARGDKAFSVKEGFMALALLWACVAVNLTWPSPYKLFGWVLWLLGSAVAAFQVWHFWRNIKTVH